MKWLGLLWLNPVRGVPLHVNNSGIPRMLWDNLAPRFGYAVRPKPNPKLYHLLVQSGLSAGVWFLWHKVEWCECGLTTQAQRRRPRGVPIATATLPPGSLPMVSRRI